jgi:paraquat-inducible protein B
MTEPLSNPSTDTSHKAPPVAVVRPRRFSITWIIPIAALVVVGVLLFLHLVRERGPAITIRFNDAAGIQPGSEIVHRGLAVGVVRDLRLTDDMTGVLATAELAPHAASLAAEGTAFWIVRPELSLDRVAGLETLLGPQYIAVRPAPTGAPRASSFDGLDTPPAIAPLADGSLRITLRAPRLGSLAPGSLVLYREIPVGAVRSATLAPDATGVIIIADIEPAYAALVRNNSRFWRSGGVGVDFGLFSGLSVRADSLSSVINSAITFATPKRPGAAPSEQAFFDLADAPDKDWLEWAPAIDLSNTTNPTIRP